ncbi:ankyrin repeat and SOCS box protein 10 isoform X2 [Denticeps clupeoides]|uniref:SOCS box domain-containing protein n=1 Tax=Denticeps clupeoides TaxID=299321 RepID=A0AAY4B9V3_9TELE|nr:ankyrin repeat and SOCS box protein 10 isoform X2 [Denticeps clupeoides]
MPCTPETLKPFRGSSPEVHLPTWSSSHEAGTCDGLQIRMTGTKHHRGHNSSQKLTQTAPESPYHLQKTSPERSEVHMGPKIKFRRPKPFRTDVVATAQATGEILQFWNAMIVGDEITAISIIDDPEYTYLVDVVFDTSNIEEWKNYRYNYRGLRLWSLTYEQELTTPLHITASRGFTECLRHLLLRGANVNLAPGGTTALHEACEECQAESVRLLLSYGANANAADEDGHMPLHLCTNVDSLECAKYLLQFGADVNGRSLDEDDAPLHVAARHGLLEHVSLYLRYGANLEHRNDEGATPLNAACSQPQEPPSLARYHQVCHLLVSAGANVKTSDADNQTPLHMACKSVNPDVVELLLQHGASVNDMCYSGDAPLHNILKMVAYKAEQQPERVVRALLNHGSIRVWPGALVKVLKYCCASPRTIEVLLNTYDRFRVTDAWVEAVPPEVLKKHQEFYESLFSLAKHPRSLQHLARHRLRTFLEGRLHKVVPSLGLPTFLKNYLLLEFRDYVH